MPIELTNTGCLQKDATHWYDNDLLRNGGHLEHVL